MNLLDRYLGRQILWYTLLVMGVLVTLAALFVFIDQQSDIGTSNYTTLDALIVTMLLVPQQAFQMLPIGALIGALVGLGNLARGSELVVVRAAGVSVVRVAVAAAGAGVVLLVIGMLVGEFLSPPLENYARHVKTFSKFSNFSFGGRAGVWVKDAGRIVSIEQQSAENVFGGIYVYSIDTAADGSRRLASIGRAERASASKSGSWRLENYAESALEPAGVATRYLARLDVQSGVSPELLGLAVLDPSSLPLRGLYRYVQQLRRNGLESRAVEVAFWSRLSRNVSTVLLCVLAVAFVFGPLRSAGAGSRTVVGIVVGVAYFLVNRTLESSGDVYGLDPLLVAWAPAAALAVVTALAIVRVR